MYVQELIHASPFYELAALLALAALVGFIGHVLRQPMVVSFIAVGVLVGPSALDIVHSHENIQVMAELGIAVLLFLVGLKLDVKLIRTLGAVAIATGLGQVTFTALFGFLIAWALGFDPVASLYIAIALTFSSTIIIVKLLSDKREVDSLHGRIAIGFLIVQDIFVVLAMMVVSTLGITPEAGEGSAWLEVGRVLLSAVIAIAAIAVFMRYLANPLVHRMAHSTELMVTFVIGWATLLAALGHYLGFSKELGGLLAGISLASTPFREAIIARLAPLRDFLLLFFFIALGTQLDLGLLGEQVGPALLFSVFVLIGNPLIVMVIMGVMGYRKRTGFLAGLTVAQISEFSLIFMAMGIGLGHVSQQSLGLVTLVGLITIALSVYMITYSHSLYRLLEPVLGLFERRHPVREQAFEAQPISTRSYDVVLVGLGRYGQAIADNLAQAGQRVLGIDFNPEVIRQWRQRGHDVVYGDASDYDFIHSLPLDAVQWVVCAIPQHDLGIIREDPRLTLVQALQQAGFRGKIALSTQRVHEREALQEQGADLVLCPFVEAAEYAVRRILNAGV